MVSPIFVLIAVLAVFVVVDTIGNRLNLPFLSDVLIFIYFMFAYANIESQTTLATFYLIGALFVLVVKLTERAFAVSSESISKIGGLSLKRGMPIFMVFAGIGIFLIMKLLQGAAPTSIVGVPSLAIASPLFSVISIMLLGIVETRLFFTIFNLIGKTGVITEAFTRIPIVGIVFAILAPIMSIIVVAILFAVFHVTAYSLALSSLLFAGVVMVIWLISFIIFKSDMPASLSHALWNFSVSASRTLGIAL